MTDFEKGEKLLYLTESGGQPKVRIVIFENEVDSEMYGLLIHVRECVGYIEPHQLYSLEEIQDMFECHDAAKARRWRAIDEGITPAALLNAEELDKIIDENKEWSRAYKKKFG